MIPNDNEYLSDLHTMTNSRHLKPSKMLILISAVYVKVLNRLMYILPAYCHFQPLQNGNGISLFVATALLDQANLPIQHILSA